MPVTAPLRSSSALVPTVVPWTTVATAPTVSTPERIPARKPWDWSGRVDGTLRIAPVPVCWSRMKTSVKVPPKSTPTM